jgi:hypothetical protein
VVVEASVLALVGVLLLLAAWLAIVRRHDSKMSDVLQQQPIVIQDNPVSLVAAFHMQNRRCSN